MEVLTSEKTDIELNKPNASKQEKLQKNSSCSDTKSNENKDSKNLKSHKALHFFRKNNQSCVHCKECLKFPEIVKLHSKNKKTPPITTNDGTKYLDRIVRDHLDSTLHDECHKAYEQATFTKAEILTKTPIGITVSQANLNLANHVGKLMLHVYSGAQKLTLSTNTFPTRVVTGNLAENFDFNHPELQEMIDLQYVTPAGHRELLEVIVQCHKAELAKQLCSTLASSLRCDGSVDRVQIDKIYTMLKVITKEGSEELYFLGATEPEERGAQGVLGAVQKGCENTVGTSANDVFTTISSIVTDGAKVNTGEEKGLWTKFEEFLKTLNAGNDQPLLKIWCSAHR